MPTDCQRKSACAKWLAGWLIGLMIGAALFPQNLSAAQEQETAEQFVERVKKAIQNDEWDRARSGLQHAIALEPGHVEAHFLLAQVHKHLGDFNLAIESLTQAVSLQPVYPEAHRVLAHLLFRQTVWAKASEEAKTAMAQGVSPLDGYTLLGDIAFRQGQFQDAIAYFEMALPAATSDQDATHHLSNKIAIAKQSLEFQPGTTPVGLVRPVSIYSGFPRYTEAARAHKVQGIVVMAVLVTDQGEVGDVEVFSELGDGLDEQAVLTARQQKFSPATKDGRAVPFWQGLQIEFNLR